MSNKRGRAGGQCLICCWVNLYYLKRIDKELILKNSKHNLYEINNQERMLFSFKTYYTELFAILL